MLKPNQDATPQTRRIAPPDHPHWQPCVLCARPVATNKKRTWLHIVDGGERFELKDEAWEGETDDLGWWPVGPTCAKKHREALKELATEKGKTGTEIYGDEIYGR